MTGVVARALAAVGFIIVGLVLWAAGGVERRAAAALEHVAELRFADAVAGYDDLEASLGVAAYLPVVGASLREEARSQRAVARYWLTDYAAIEPIDDAAALTGADPAFLLAAANAMYRRASESPGTADRAMKAYAGVLTAAPGHADAAFNYELVARRREAMASASRGAQPAGAPSTATIHGDQGAPPKGTDMGQFKVVIPKRGEERKEDPEAGEGKPRIRKG